MSCKPCPSTWRVMLALLLLLVSACGTQPVAPLPPAPLQVPPLPASARQPPLPALCSPTCSVGLMTLRADWQRRLIEATPPAEGASGPTTR